MLHFVHERFHVCAMCRMDVTDKRQVADLWLQRVEFPVVEREEKVVGGLLGVETKHSEVAVWRAVVNDFHVLDSVLHRTCELDQISVRCACRYGKDGNDF